jgi:hypothetical protein
MEHDNEKTLIAFVFSNANLEDRFEVTNPETESQVIHQRRNYSTDSDLEAYAVTLLDMSGNMQVISSD